MKPSPAKGSLNCYSCCDTKILFIVLLILLLYQENYLQSRNSKTLGYTRFPLVPVHFAVPVTASYKNQELLKIMKTCHGVGKGTFSGSRVYLNKRNKASHPPMVKYP